MSVLRKPPVFGLVVAVFAATAAAWAFQPDRPIGYVSTGQMPQAERVKALVDEAYEKFKTNTEGKNADYIPALAKVPSNLFGVCVVNVGGAVYSVGDVDSQFSIQSVSKPFVFALVCQAYGDEEARKKIGVNATGLPFNSLLAIEQNKNRTVNPLVNAGAIAAASFVPGANAEEKCKRPFALDCPTLPAANCLSTKKCYQSGSGDEVNGIKAWPDYSRPTSESPSTQIKPPTFTPSNARSTSPPRISPLWEPRWQMAASIR